MATVDQICRAHPREHVEELAQLESRDTGKPIQMPGLQDVAEQLSTAFDTKVTVSLGKRKGKIVVEFGSVDDLQRIVELMKTEQG